MNEDVSLEEIFRAIVGHIKPLNNSYKIYPAEVWSIWIMPLGRRKGLWITYDSPDPLTMPDGCMLTVTTNKAWWQFWRKDISTTYNYRISPERFLQELGKMSKSLEESRVHYYDETDLDSRPFPARFDLTAFAI